MKPWPATIPFFNSSTCIRQVWYSATVWLFCLITRLSACILQSTLSYKLVEVLKKCWFMLSLTLCISQWWVQYVTGLDVCDWGWMPWDQLMFLRKDFRIQQILNEVPGSRTAASLSIITSHFWTRRSRPCTWRNTAPYLTVIVCSLSEGMVFLDAF